MTTPARAGKKKVHVRGKDRLGLFPETFHITLVTNATWNIYNFRQPLIRAFLDQGWQVSVIAPVDKYIVYLEQLPEVQHIHLEGLDRKGVNPWQDARLVQTLTGLYRRLQPDLIIHFTHKPNLYGGWAAHRLGIPSLAVITGLGYPFLHNPWLKKLISHLYRFSSRFHRRLLFENAADCQLFKALGIRSSNQPDMVVSGCGVDTQHYAPMHIAPVPGVTLFTFVGRLIYDKGIREFVQAAQLVHQEFPHTRFRIVGEIDKDNPAAIQESELIRWIRHEAIEYAGYQRDVRPHLAQSDCIVLPSYREAIARSLSEAMSMEKPVIASDVPGCNTMIDHGENGYLVPVKNADALAEAMVRILTLSRHERLQMGREGRQKINQYFSDEIVTRQYVEQIYQLTGLPRPKRHEVFELSL